MRALLLALAFVLGCATSEKYDAKVQTWKGKDADTLVKAWGQPDVIEKMDSGNRMYVYARLKHAPLAYDAAQRTLASVETSPSRSPASLYIKCSTLFEVNPRNTIVTVIFRGDECVSKD